MSFHYQFFADQLDNPNNGDWAVSLVAPVVADSRNTALSIRRFDETTEEGVGWLLFLENSMSIMQIQMTTRPQNPPTQASRQARHRLYSREIPDGASIPAWNFHLMDDMTYGLSTIFWQRNAHNITLNTGASGPTLSAGKLYQFELTRVSRATGVAGDLDLLELHIEVN